MVIPIPRKNSEVSYEKEKRQRGEEVKKVHSSQLEERGQMSDVSGQKEKRQRGEEVKKVHSSQLEEAGEERG